MSKVQMTVQQITDLGLWDRVCEYKGWNPWIKNEGLIANNEVVEFDSEFKKEPIKKEYCIASTSISVDQLEEWIELLEDNNPIGLKYIKEQINNILDSIPTI